MKDSKFIWVNNECYISHRELANYIGVYEIIVLRMMHTYNAVYSKTYSFNLRQIWNPTQVVQAVRYKKILFWEYKQKISIGGQFYLNYENLFFFVQLLKVSFKDPSSILPKENEEKVVRKCEKLITIFMKQIRTTVNEDQIESVAKQVTQQGFITGFTIARMLQEDHIYVHDKVYNYYQKNKANEPIIYFMDPDTRQYVHIDTTYPNPQITIKDYGYPTYGFMLNHTKDLYALYYNKKEVISIIERALQKWHRY